MKRPSLRRAMLGLLLLPLAVQGAGPPRTDTQLWSELDVDTQVLPATTLTATALLRDGSSVPNPTIWGGGLAVDHRFSDALSAGVGELVLQARSAENGARLDVRAPLAAVTATWKLGSVSVSDRNRLERLEGAPGNPWRYRNRLMVDTPLAEGGTVAALFASDEVFYDDSRGRWTRNRLQAGARFVPFGPAIFEAYLMRQDDAYARPASLNIIGLAVRLNLD